jgi:DNA primase
MLDGDEAGDRASRRLLPLFLNENVLAREVRLPEGEDPDTYAQKIGAEELTRVVDRAPLHLDATIERIFRTHQGTVEGEIEATRMVMTVLNHFSDVTAREIRMKHIADRLGVSLGSLRDVGRGAKPQVKSVSGSVSGPKNSSVSGSASGSKSSSVSASGSKPAAPVKQPEVLTSIWDERLLQLIVQFPRRLSYPTLSSAVDILSSERVRRAVEELATLFSEYGFDAADSPVEERERDFLNLIKEKWSEEPRRLHWLARVRMHEEIKEPEGAEDREWEDCIARLREDKYRKESRQAQFTMKNLHPERHWDEVADLMKKQLKRAQERLGMKEVP